MLKYYLQAAMMQARYETHAHDRLIYGEIPGFPGVYASNDTYDECRTALKDVLEEWVLLRLFMHLPLPVVDGIELTIKRVD